MTPRRGRRPIRYSGAEQSEAPGIHNHRSEMTVTYAPRRSAVHEPEQAPPVQEPPPKAPDSRPMPVALLPPALIVTVMAPVCAILPVTVKAVSPALISWPLEMRIG